MTTTTQPSARPGFRHDAYVYNSPERFARDMSSFVREGLGADELVAVAETRDNIDLLRDHLGEDARDVEFLDMVAIGRNPARILAVWEDFVVRGLEAGRGMRGIGEPAWPGRRELELTECRVHELLLNTAFDPGPPWWLVCPYDSDRLPAEAVAEALHTHPTRLGPGGSRTNSGYDAGVAERALTSPLPPPPPHAVRHDYDADSLLALRPVIRAFVGSHELPAGRSDALVLACWEVGVNSVVHGGGAGALHLWRESDALAFQFEDAGHITDPLVGRRRPDSDSGGGRGIYLANHLCDLVQVRSSAAGTSVRLLAWL